MQRLDIQPQRATIFNKARIGAAAAVFGSLLASTIAIAGPAPVKKPGTKNLSFTDTGRALAIKGRLTQLEKRDVFLSLFATAELEVICVPPTENQLPMPSPERVEVDLYGFDNYPKDKVKYRRLDIEVHTDEIGETIPNAPHCPDRTWTEQVTGVRFLDAKLVIRQGASDDLAVICTFKPIANGKIPADRMKCFNL